MSTLKLQMARYKMGCIFGIGGAAVKTFQIMERKSAINALSKDGLVPEKIEGRIEFRDVDFVYPTRPLEQILEKFNLTIEPNTTTAFVGESGCGKSTLVSLLERFYDPNSGEILLDGVGLTKLNVQWLRTHMALVSQRTLTSYTDSLHYYGIYRCNSGSAVVICKIYRNRTVSDMALVSNCLRSHQRNSFGAYTFKRVRMALSR